MSIYVGTNESNAVYSGSTMTSAVYLGDFLTWPAGFYYTLEYTSTTYSSGNSLYASASNYATFTCKYKKHRRSNGNVVETTTVTATPSATYFTADGTKLKFNKTDYGRTVVSSGSKNVTLSYGGLSITSTVQFSGNSKSYRSEISAVVPDVSVFPARGADSSYSGGVVTTYEHWSSGLEDYYNTQNADFGSAPHSLDNTKSAYTVAYTKSIYVPSLGTTTLNAGTYTFNTTTNYNGTTSSFTVSQQANSVESSTSSGVFYDSSNNVISGTMNIDTSQRTIMVSLKVTTTRVYTSNASTTSTTSINVSDCSYGYYNTSVQSGPITGVYGYNQQFEININRNTSEYSRSAVFYVTYQGNSYTFNITQAAAQVSYYYTLTDASLNYSSNTKLTADGNNYCYWTCKYKKYNALDNSLVSTENVKAIPSATYFKNYDSSLYFNYDEYKGYTVSSGNKTAVLTYGDASTSGTFNFGGNTSTSVTTVTEAIPNPSSYPASGGSGTYTGGVYNTRKTWTSGYVEDTSGNINYNYAPHSNDSTVIAGTNYADKTITIPNLHKNSLSAGTYTFSSSSNYNGSPATFTVSQASNVPSQTHSLKVFDYDTGNELGQYNTVSSAAQAITFSLADAITYSYPSGEYSTGSPSNIEWSNYSWSIQTYSGTWSTQPSIYYAGTYYLTLNIPINSTGNQRLCGLIITYNNTTIGITFSQSG